MKIETLKSTGYTKREDTLRILVCAENRQQVNDVLAGKETTTLWFDAVQYEIPVDTALQMLAALELYALDCYNVTQSHIASVKLLDDISMLTEYDYTTGYPEKLVFNLNT